MWQRFISVVVLLYPAIAFTASVERPGVLVYRNAAGLQFSEAISLTVNGKDKILNLGNAAELMGPPGKLPSQKIEGTLLMDGAQGVLVLYAEESVEYLFPSGLPKNNADSPKSAWATAAIAYRKSSSEKTPAGLAANSMVAFLPGGVEELASLCNDDRALRLLAGPGKAFSFQIELMSATVKAYSNDPALAPLERYLENSMRSRYSDFERGSKGLETLEQCLKLAELSLAVYPKEPSQETLRKQITERKAWLDRRIAIQKAFAAAADWDTFLLGGKALEKYELAVPEVANLRTKALHASLEAHQRAGETLLAENEYQGAFREFSVAALLQPSDKLLQQKVLISWSDYSRQVALDNRRNRRQLGAGEREALMQDIQFAGNYKNENKLDLALKSILAAEAIDPESLPMLLKKAEILGAQRNFTAALETVNKYDLRAVDEERDKASSLRNDLLFKQISSLEDIRAQLQKAWQERTYHRIRDLALEGVRAKDDDADLLYQAGVISLITRQSNESAKFFARYLDVSNTLDARAEQRAKVRSMLANLSAAEPVEMGEPNWMSGKKLGGNVYYCPLSLAFQPHIDHIEGANKMRVSYEWDGSRLNSIVPSFDKPEHDTGERKISFWYDEHFPQVASVSSGMEQPPRKNPAAGTDELVKQSSLVILNNPYINPDAVEKLTGDRIAVGFSGNRFFQPFVWEKIHYFRLTYDTSGRVAEASELSGLNGVPTALVLQFEWSGQQLLAIRGYEGADEKHRIKTYERSLKYQDGRLASEEIKAAGKFSSIKYHYNGGRLAAATCERDATLDDRARQVVFR